MKLTDLEPRYLTWIQRDDGVYFDHVDTIDKAQGIAFLCPKCFVEHGGAEGTHQVVCWSRSRGVPNHAKPGPGRWTISGTRFDDLTLGAEPGLSASVLVLGGCGWHGFVTNGEVT